MNDLQINSYSAWPAREYGALIFDCDGTLTDSMPVHYQAWHAAMQKWGVDFSVSRFYELAGMPTEKIISLLAAEQAVSVNVEQATGDKEANFFVLLDQLIPIPVTVEVARHFRGKIPIAVASGGNRESVVRQLAKIGCHDWFDAIVTSEDTVRHKPEPDVFLEAARQLGVSPEQCLVYEDSDLGIQAATAAGMDSIDVRQILTG
jgi:beta-phosphoglucomutase family hydrolase